MAILYSPKFGYCSECHGYHLVRDYQTEYSRKTICFSCWNTHQTGSILISTDWDLDVTFLFHITSHHGTTQRAASSN
jgi:hypothetical protein